jgi:hypothetical protein
MKLESRRGVGLQMRNEREVVSGLLIRFLGGVSVIH